MKTIRLDISHIQTVRALHVYMAYMLDFPAYYGNNLDALHDLLCERGESVRIALCGAPASAEMAAYLPRLACVLEDCTQENPLIHFGRIG